MFRRVKRQGDDPRANELSGAAEPNVLKVTKPGKSGETDTEWAWTADGMTPVEPEEGQFDDEPEAAGETHTMTPEELQAELERQAEEFGLTGNNPVGLYGPNGVDVAAILDALPKIDDETAEALADAYESIPEAERKVAQSVVRRRHRGGKWAYELDLAERGVTDWVGSLRFNDDSYATIYAIVANAATDAVDAIILEDELADADFDTLYGAWSEIMDDEEDADGDAESDATEAEPGEAQVEAQGEGEESETEDDGPFGPNSELVVEFLDKLAGLDGARIATLVETWREQPKEKLRVAHRSLQDLADEEKLWREQLRLAQEQVFAWMESRTTTYLEHFATTRADAQVRELAGPVVADSIAALTMADVLEPEDAAVLYAPWAESVGEPALPEFEDSAE
jgi:hypothetical protein